MIKVESLTADAIKAMSKEGLLVAYHDVAEQCSLANAILRKGQEQIVVINAYLKKKTEEVEGTATER